MSPLKPTIKDVEEDIEKTRNLLNQLEAAISKNSVASIQISGRSLKARVNALYAHCSKVFKFKF